MRKLRILWLGEASFLSTGYAVYTHEILKRLHATGKYDIAELASYGHWNDDKRFEIPWRYYGNLPDTHDDDAAYHSSILNEFGQWKFEETCLDWKPDIVCDPRDWWMSEYVERSPFRDMFKWAIMPTVDSIPQQEQWLATFMDADAVFNYCEFGRDYLEETLGSQVNLCGLAPPAANTDFYYPMDKGKVRDSLGMDRDTIIIGTVMRNMKRKLYPNLIDSFRRFVDENPEISKKVYLYIHCSYPDSGWDIPKLIREAGIGHKVMFTYLCAKCKHVFPSFFQDSLQPCPNCGGATAGLPNQRVGCSTEDMGRIINSFDLYVQYSICEGFGMPQVEAAMCGVPVMAVDYSAMSSVMQNLGGIPINVERLQREPDSHAFRAFPDDEHLIEEWVKFVQQPETLRNTKGRKMYLKCKSTYSYDNSAAQWEKYFDSVEPQDLWDTVPPRLHKPDFNIPDGLTNEQFTRWIIGNVWGRPDKMDSFTALRLMRDLNYRMSMVQAGESYFNEESTPGQRRSYSDFKREDAVKQMADLNQKDQYWEERRAGFIQERKLLFVQNCKKGIDE
jgi:glycosyltransferase involved in cell wall biosynthesis